MHKWTVLKQLKKVGEEVFELIEQVAKLNTQGIISEGLDVIQSVFTLFLIIGIDEKTIQSHLKLHYQKLESRGTHNNLTIEEWIEF